MGKIEIFPLADVEEANPNLDVRFCGDSYLVRSRRELGPEGGGIEPEPASRVGGLRAQVLRAFADGATEELHEGEGEVVPRKRIARPSVEGSPRDGACERQRADGELIRAAHADVPLEQVVTAARRGKDEHAVGGNGELETGVRGGAVVVIQQDEVATGVEVAQERVVQLLFPSADPRDRFGLRSPAIPRS